MNRFFSYRHDDIFLWNEVKSDCQDLFNLSILSSRCALHVVSLSIAVFQFRFDCHLRKPCHCRRLSFVSNKTEVTAEL